MSRKRDDPEQIEADRRATLLEAGSEVRRWVNELTTFAAQFPDPRTAEIMVEGRRQRELVSAALEPPTVEEAQLGSIEIAADLLSQACDLLQDAAEVTQEGIAEQWHRQQALDHRMRAAQLCQRGEGK